MKPKKKQFNLDTFLDKAKKARSTCAFCKDDTLRETLEAFMAKKAAGETHVALNYLFDHCLVPILGAPRNPKAVYNHVRVCMGLDPTTGRPLNAET